MADIVATGNEFLDSLPVTPLPHLVTQAPESSPPTTPSPDVHIGAPPDAGAKGSV